MRNEGIDVSLSDALARNKATRKGPNCTLCQLIIEMPTGEREVLSSALNDGTFTSAAIARALKEEGFEFINASTVIRHRRSECARRDVTE